MPKFKDIRKQLEEAKRIATDLDAIAKLDESLVRRSQENLSSAKRAAVLEKLASLPIENMKDATDSSLRVETLRKFGLTSVASIYHSSVGQLEKINGISAESARELKFIAERMHDAVADSIAYGVNLDELSVDDLNLLENVQGLEGIRSKLRGNHSKLRPLADSISSGLAQAKPLSSRFIWMLSGSTKRAKALDAISNIAMVLGEPNTMLLASLANDALNYAETKRPDPVVEDFKKRSSDYYAVLEDIGGSNQQLDQRHFDKELIKKIEDCELDLSRIKATMRKYQVFGTKFALTQKRVIIGDEMGLGKTMQAMGVLTEREAQGAQRFLVICPASVLVNWERELLDTLPSEVWTNPKLKWLDPAAKSGSILREVALVTLLITVSNIHIFKLGAPFWGLVGGVIVHQIVVFKKR